MTLESAKLLVGLGNPGSKYKFTRHNMGFLVLDQLAKENQIEFKKQVRFNAEIAKMTYQDQTVYLLKPMTFMNKSGLAVKKCLDFYKLKAKNTMVIVDDAAFEFEELRLKPKGSCGGHNGLRDIERHLGGDYPRLKMGIGAPKGSQTLENYVLESFNTKEVALLGHFIDRAMDAIYLWLNKGLDKAMNQVNTIIG